ncbi:MAG: class I SAM-dependent methyltransferase [Nitrospirota bacterium]
METRQRKSINCDDHVIAGFGDEWSRFDQSGLTDEDQQVMFNDYFSIFPWDKLPEQSMGFDLGCGSGRWAKLVAPKVGQLHCIDASGSALDVARKNLATNKNCKFHIASVDSIPLADESADFAYSLGVLHHIPDTTAGIKACVSKLKRGAPFLLYLYYAFDNKPSWYRLIWKLSETGRFLISRMPFPLKYVTSQLIALSVYWPLARLALMMELLGFYVDSFPLSYYRKRSFYVMRTDALDRFGTSLEKRFTRDQIRKMMEDAGLENILFSDSRPYWCAVGYKK